MSDAALQLLREQQQIEELCAAAIRALAGERDLHFRCARLHRGSQRLPSWAPHLHPLPGHDDLGSFRGAADGLALRLRYSDAALHETLQPADSVQRLIFGLLEQLRCESLADAAHAGVLRNLRYRHGCWSDHFERAGLLETRRGLMLYALARTARARISGEPLDEATADRIESARSTLSERVGSALGALRSTRRDQAAFARHALTIANGVAEWLQSLGDEPERAGAARPRDAAAHAALNLLLDPDAEPAAGVATAAADGQRSAAETGSRAYRVFTRAYDREGPATRQLRTAQLAEHRKRLDRRVAAQGANVPRLARALQALFATPATEGWNDGQEQGRIDGRRLAQLVAAPTQRRVFHDERRVALADAALTLLVDCSGSMKVHAESVAALADVVLRAADLAGVRTELLGFSTGAWRGGRAAGDWMRAGRPPRPGRLAELAHLVFKDAATPWRQARRGIAALLEPTLFREGIDGEAVDWACARLRAIDARQRLLVVVSDGCPMETATLLANEPQILDEHLRAVVLQQEALGDIAICGLGVGLDLSPYFGRCLAIDLDGPPGNAVFVDLLHLLGGRVRR